MSHENVSDVVVLHGANGSAAEIEPLSAALRAFAPVFTPNLPGHGGRPVPQRMSIADHAADVLAAIEAERIDRPFIVGYSLGGLVGMYLARHHPERVRGVCAVGTKVVFDAATVKHWTYLVDPARLGRPGNPRAGQLEKTHAPQDWRAVAMANSRLFEDLGRAPPLDDAAIGAISVPLMLANSNRDQIVPWAETLAIRKLVPASKLVMFYGLAHPITVVPVHSLAPMIDAWMKEMR